MMHYLRFNWSERLPPALDFDMRLLQNNAFLLPETEEGGRRNDGPIFLCTIVD